MKHPLTETQLADREMVCLFLGHNWKSSWKRNLRPFENSTEEYQEIPYRDRQSGNPYFEFSAGWQYKCRRCRYHTRSDAFSPFYVDYYRAVRATISSVISSWKFRNDPDMAVASKLWFVVWCGLSGVSQFLVYVCDERHWPWFLADVTVELEWKVAEKAFKE